jgi:hypothetical protein
MSHEPTVRLSARQRYEWRGLVEHPNVPARQIATTYEVRGTLDVKRLAEALRVVLAHHDQLRLRLIGSAHAPIATRRPAPDVVTMPVIDLDGLDESTCDRLVDLYQEREAATLLDLGTDWPLRMMLLRLSPHRHLLLLTAHHLVADGWSVGLIARHLCAAYHGDTLAQAPSMPSYDDFVVAEQARLASPTHRTQLGWWVQQLRDLPSVPRLGSIEGVRTYDAIDWRYEVPAEDCAALRRVARTCGASTFAVAVAALAASLGRRTGVWRWPMWVPYAGPRLPDFAQVVGLFANRLPLIVRIDPKTSFLDAVRATRASLLDLIDHAELGYFELVAAVPALAAVQLTVQHMPAVTFDTTDPRFSFRRYRIAASPLDLVLSLNEMPDGTMWWDGEHRTDVIRPVEAKGLLDDLLADTHAFVCAPDVNVQVTAQRLPT